MYYMFFGKRKSKWQIAGFLVILIVVSVCAANYCPPYDTAVTHYSDVGPRVGNNVYGYIDMPEGFYMTGSFNPEHADYAGGQDGIAEGVQLKNEEGTMYIIISLITPDVEKEDYIGFGDGRYCLSKKKLLFFDFEDVFLGMLEEMVEKDILEPEADGFSADGTYVYFEEFPGICSKWKGKIEGEEYQYRTYIFENPENKRTFHCVTVAYTDGNEACEDYVRTFSLLPEGR